MMMAPTIHLNGTSAEALLAGYMDAAHVLRDALIAVARTAPNGRDYYPQGESAYTAAAREHTARLLAVTSVLKEIERLSTAVLDQTHKGTKP